ncbi:MAG: TIGR01212 family radical SAM protein [Oscillospiraceae bacterium]|nr:TIGR01212 family radical SAM protein [Oscillospiraceae bacterium]
MKHPYYTMNQLMHEHYGKKIRKICIDGGFTCPNRDGTCGTGGCTFCGARGAGEQLDPTKTIREQAEAVLKNAPADSAWIVYFQNFTNTYAAPEILRERYDAALFDERVKVLDIGTRPDCITEEIADLLAKYAEKYEVWTELGLQTASDKTAKAINRGYDLNCFERAVQMLKTRGLPVIVHIIIGLPDETPDDLRHTVSVLNRCHIDGIKIHSLFIMKDTKLAEQYEAGAFTPISMQTYIDRTIDVLTHISPDTVIHRVTGNCLREQLLAPDWIPQRDLIITTIDRKMAANGWYQGCFYQPEMFPVEQGISTKGAET